MGKLRASELREKKIKDLVHQVGDLKKELASLRVAQVTNGAASKLSKIDVVRKNIARVLTVVNQKARNDMRKQVAGKKRMPKQLRQKKTRALRRALPAELSGKRTVKVSKKVLNFPLRRFAAKA
jgi:large subunit ribosomal protein L35e